MSHPTNPGWRRTHLARHLGCSSPACRSNCWSRYSQTLADTIAPPCERPLASPSLCLISRALLPCARSLLYENIVLGLANSILFLRTMHDRPTLGLLVKSLASTWAERVPPELQDIPLPELFRFLPSLRFLAIDHRYLLGARVWTFPGSLETLVLESRLDWAEPYLQFAPQPPPGPDEETEPPDSDAGLYPNWRFSSYEPNPDPAIGCKLTTLHVITPNLSNRYFTRLHTDSCFPHLKHLILSLPPLAHPDDRRLLRRTVRHLVSAEGWVYGIRRTGGRGLESVTLRVRRGWENIVCRDLGLPDPFSFDDPNGTEHVGGGGAGSKAAHIGVIGREADYIRLAAGERPRGPQEGEQVTEEQELARRGKVVVWDIGWRRWETACNDEWCAGRAEMLS